MIAFLCKLLLAEEPTPALFEEIREYYGLGIQEFCEVIDVERQNYHKMRTGERPITTIQRETFFKLVENIDYIEGETPLFEQVMEKVRTIPVTEIELDLPAPSKNPKSVLMAMMVEKGEGVEPAAPKKKGPEWRYAMIQMIAEDEGSKYSVHIRMARKVEKIKLRKPSSKPPLHRAKRVYEPIPAPPHRDEMNDLPSGGSSVQVSERTGLLPSF